MGLEVVLCALEGFLILVNYWHASFLCRHQHSLLGKHVVLNIVGLLVCFKEEAVVLKHKEILTLKCNTQQLNIYCNDVIMTYIFQNKALFNEVIHIQFLLHSVDISKVSDAPLMWVINCQDNERVSEHTDFHSFLQDTTLSFLKANLNHQEVKQMP